MRMFCKDQTGFILPPVVGGLRDGSEISRPKFALRFLRYPYAAKALQRFFLQFVAKSIFRYTLPDSAMTVQSLNEGAFCCYPCGQD
jgi:hypothetical protein